MWTLCAVLLVLLGLSVSTRSQENVVVEESDPSLVYNPPKSSWTPNKNPQPGPNGTSVADYFHGGGYLSIAVIGASVSLTFNGSYIAYYSDLYFTHGEMEIDLNGAKTSMSTRSDKYPEGTPRQKLFEAYVNPNRSGHTITLTNKEARTMALDYFLYTAVPVENTEQHSQTSGPTKGDSPHDLPAASSPTTSPREIPGTPNNPTSTAPPTPQDSLSEGTSTLPPTVSSTAKGAISSLASDEPTSHTATTMSRTTIIAISVVSTLTFLFMGFGICCFRLRRRAGKVQIGAAPSEAGRRLVSSRTSSSSITPFLIQPALPVSPTKATRASTRIASNIASPVSHQPDSDAMAINLSTPPSYAEAHITQ